jgi:hypothetical protein
MKFLRLLYILGGTSVIVLFTAASLRGWELGSPKREKAGPSARSAAGSRYYHSGYRGGK